MKARNGVRRAAGEGSTLNAPRRAAPKQAFVPSGDRTRLCAGEGST